MSVCKHPRSPPAHAPHGFASTAKDPLRNVAQRRRSGIGYSHPATRPVVEDLAVRLATENRDWGYRRIQSALANLGHEVARGAIANVLEEHGLDAAPERNRKATWKEFPSRHWEVIVAADFFTVEVWTSFGPRGLSFQVGIQHNSLKTVVGPTELESVTSTVSRVLMALIGELSAENK